MEYELRLTRKSGSPGSFRDIELDEVDSGELDIFYEELLDGSERLTFYRNKYKDEEEVTGEHVSAS